MANEDIKEIIPEPGMEVETDSNPKVEEPAAPQPEPSIVFFYDLKNLYRNISALSKVELLDMAPVIGTHFYFDFNQKAYLFVISKTKWDGLPEDMRRKFTILSRRIKEEMNGMMSTLDREKYENTDLFETFMNQANEAKQNQESVN